MEILLDTHSHTIMSGHAYSTLNEMAYTANEKNLKLLCITDHAPKMPGGPSEVYFRNFKSIDKFIYNVEIFMGVELNILNFNGDVDLPDKTLNSLDIAIASFHRICTKPGTIEENTNAFLNVMNNPNINILGHPEDGNIPIDFEKVVKKAKDTNTLIELNNSSLKPTSGRLNTKENATKLLQACKAEGAFITIASDAHFNSKVGDFTYALELIKEINFPKELVINTNVERFKEFIKK